MRITRDRKNQKLDLSQVVYIEKVLKRFNMNNAKPVSTPLANHFNLTKVMYPRNDKEKEHLAKVPYASIIGSLMYVMVCTRPDIAQAVGFVSRYMSNPGKEHWQELMDILVFERYI